MLHGGREHFVLLVNSRERAIEIPFIEIDLGERLFGDFLDNGALGNDGHTSVNFDSTFDGLDVIEFHHVLHFDVVLLQDFVERFAGGDVRLETDEFLAGKRLKFDTFLFGERMLRMADEDQGVFAQRNNFQFAVAIGISNEAKVHDVSEDVFVNLVGTAIFDVDRDGWIRLEKLLQIRRQIVQANAVNGGDADGAGNDILDLLKAAVQGIISSNDLLAIIIKNLPFAGESEFLFATLNEKRFESSFKRTNLLADRRLRYFVDLRGFGKALRFGQVAENFQCLNLHKKLE